MKALLLLALAFSAAPAFAHPACEDQATRRNVIMNYTVRNRVAGGEAAAAVYEAEKGKVGTPLEVMTPELRAYCDETYGHSPAIAKAFAGAVNGDGAGLAAELHRYGQLTEVSEAELALTFKTRPQQRPFLHDLLAEAYIGRLDELARVLSTSENLQRARIREHLETLMCDRILDAK